MKPKYICLSFEKLTKNQYFASFKCFVRWSYLYVPATSLYNTNITKVLLLGILSVQKPTQNMMLERSKPK